MEGRPWGLVIVVSGFASQHAALAFESAWQRPHASRHVSRVWHALRFGRCSVRTCVRVRLEALALLLGNGYWAFEVLTVHDVGVRACAEQLQRVRAAASAFERGWHLA